jgi:hypothetical protein
MVEGLSCYVGALAGLLSVECGVPRLSCDVRDHDEVCGSRGNFTNFIEVEPGTVVIPDLNLIASIIAISKITCDLNFPHLR